jgi:AcrR family transcriptional regulator
MVEAILQGGARVLVRDGYDRASTNRIAEAAGVSVGSLYQYFPSKEAIVAALIDRHLEKVVGLVGSELASLGALPLRAAVERVVRAFFRAEAIDSKLRRVFIEQVPRVGGLKRFAEVEGQIVQLARAFLEQRGEITHVPDLELALFVLVHAIAATTYAVTVEPGRFPEKAVVAELSRLVLGHLSAHE